MDKRIETIINHEDKYSKNLNKVFGSYGCETLEAKVPVVESPTVQRMREIDEEQQLYAALALKSESAMAAVRGRRPKTRNSELQVVEINGQTMLSVGAVRDRSPVNRDELDSELDSYMKEVAKRRAKQSGNDDSMSVDEELPSDIPMKSEIKQEPMPSSSTSSQYNNKTRNIPLKPRPLSDIKSENNSSPTPRENRQKAAAAAAAESRAPIDEEALDVDLEFYMQEAARLRKQRKDMEILNPNIRKGYDEY